MLQLSGEFPADSPPRMEVTHGYKSRAQRARTDEARRRFDPGDDSSEATRHHDIAAFFGVNQGRIAEIKDGTRFPGVLPADADELPPMGPYLAPKVAWLENRLR